MRALAVDWSGATHGAHHRIWLAETSRPGQLVRLECGRDRAAMAALLAETRGQSVVGLDFSFGVPAWFAEQLGADSGPAVWRRVAEQGEAWLATCPSPFWGRPGRPRPRLAGSALRQTELDVPRTAGIAPKSIFQVGGAGAVGTGSIRGMPLLICLQQAGAAIWPFDPPGWPLVVEIYPRLLTGPVHKANPSARRALLERRYPRLDPAHLAAASASEDAFDAAVSALVMREHADDLASLPAECDVLARLEGRIWHPGWRVEVPLVRERRTSP